MENLKSPTGSKASFEGPLQRFRRSVRERFSKRQKGSRGSLKSKVNTESVSLWFKSLENVLGDKVGLDLFHKYLKSEFSEENLEFWMSCEEFKNAKQSSLECLAASIYAEYIVSSSPKEVNLDSRTRERICEKMTNPCHEMFLEAQHRIEGLMEKDTYRRFLSSTALSSWAAHNDITLPQI